MTDAELVERFFSRDESAIAAVGLKYGAYLRTVAENILGDEGAAEECVADACLKAWNAIPPARPEKLRAFIAKITRNAAVNRLKSEKAMRRGRGEAAAVLEELAECLPARGSVEGDFDAKELELAVNRFVKELPDREGDIFVRRCFFTEPPAKIAARYGMTAHGVTVSLSRTRGKLRAYLIKEGFIDD